MKEIELTQGKVAIVDDEDYDRANQYKWRARENKRTGVFYAIKHKTTVDSYIYMHRFILQVSNEEQVDHICGDTLDNRKSQLRICSNMENSRNQKIRNDNSSGAKGVYWSKEKNKWRVQIRVNGIKHHLGYFSDKALAIDVYNLSAIEYFGEYARINLRGEDETV